MLLEEGVCYDQCILLAKLCKALPCFILYSKAKFACYSRCLLLHDPNNHDGMITHLEPDIQECKVKWALESITMNKGSGGDGIPVEIFQILKDDAVKVLPANLENLAVATGLQKVSFHSNPKEVK